MVNEPQKAEPVVIEGRVKWYDATRGYGFVVSDALDGDILTHANCVRASGRAALPEGAKVRIQAALFDRGWQAVAILDVEPVVFDGLAEEPSGFVHPDISDAGPVSPARVKWFDRVKGFGFVNIFGSVDDVFVHMEVLRRSSIADLAPGEAVAVRVVAGPRGLMAAEVRPWDEVALAAAAGAKSACG